MRIRCDNGKPFGGPGSITPGRPGENSAHAQFHRFYRAEVLARPARSRRAQQPHSERRLEHYNRERPHEALGIKRLAEVFRRNRRRLPRRLVPWTYQRR